MYLVASLSFVIRPQTVDTEKIGLHKPFVGDYNIASPKVKII